MVNIVSDTQWDTNAALDSFKASLLNGLESSVKNPHVLSVCHFFGLEAKRARIENWIELERAYPEMLRSIDMEAAIARAVRHTSRPETLRLKHRISRSAPVSSKNDNFNFVSVLMVQSNKTIGKITRKALQSFGIENVVEVPSVDIAVEALRINSFDLIITNDQEGPITSLPLMQMANAAKAGGNDDPFILLLSMRADIGAYTELKEAGLTAFLRAPFECKAFYRALKVLVSGIREQEVLSTNYCGPNRRNVQNKPTHYVDRRCGDPLLA